MKRFIPLLIFLLTVNLGFAQGNLTVTGKVIEASGGALPGTTVQVKGTSIGTVTDASGNYSVSAPGNGTLVFTFLGFVNQEVAINNRTSINITMTPDAKALEEVVVVGYGVQRKRDLTGSITSVKGDEIGRQPNTNPLSSLQGKVAGLTIVNSGQAGSSPTVRIRGVNSTGNTNPLYVVDGIFQNNIDYLNPADIESIEVLRDPSSIAIFGLQGGNGVIIVTTKRAAKGETRVNFQSTVGIQRVQKKIDLVDAAGFRRLYDVQLTNLRAAPFDYTNYTGNTDWQDQIFRDAMITNNTLSITNSGEKSTTLVSLGYNNQEGVLKYDNYKRYIVRLNQENRITDKIKVGADLTGFNFRRQAPAANITNALWAAPIVPIQLDENTYYSMPSFQRAQVGNPVANLNRNTGTAIDGGYRVVGSLFGELKILKDFTWRSSVYANLGFNNTRDYTPLPYTFINLGEGAAPTTNFYDNLARTSVSQSQSENRRFQQDHTLTYNKVFKEKHSVTVLGGFTTLFTASSSLTGSRRDTTLFIPRDPDFWYLGISDASNPMSNGGGGSEIAYMSFLGRINYAYNDKYLVNATFRRDGSSIFAPGSTRWGNFSSLGLGWVVSEESFFKNLNALDFLKLRASWGEVGSAMGFPANLYQAGAVIANRAIFGNNVNTSVGPAYVPDPKLHWEVVRGIDLGLEFRALNNRLSSDLTFYDRTTRDILTRLTLPGTAGNYEYRTNLGNISNRGIELSLGWNDEIGSGFSYSINPNVSYNQNNVESIGPSIEFQILGNGGVNVTQTNQSIGYFYGYKQTGIYQATADLDKTPSFSNSLPGDIAYEDVNGDGVLTPADRTYLGSPFPKWNFGSSFSAAYKGFDAMIDIQGVAGNKIYTQRRTATFAVLNYEANRLNAWSGPGTSNIEPILDNTRANNFLFSSYYLEPGDYFRFRNVQLGYNFSSLPGLAKVGVKNLRVSLSGQNIATFSKTTGYSPEASLADPIASGSDNGTYPVPAIYSIGINATF